MCAIFLQSCTVWLHLGTKMLS